MHLLHIRKSPNILRRTKSILISLPHPLLPLKKTHLRLRTHRILKTLKRRNNLTHHILNHRARIKKPDGFERGITFEFCFSCSILLPLATALLPRYNTSNVVHSSSSFNRFLAFSRSITVAPIIEVNSTVASPSVSYPLKSKMTPVTRFALPVIPAPGSR